MADTSWIFKDKKRREGNTDNFHSDSELHELLEEYKRELQLLEEHSYLLEYKKMADRGDVTRDDPSWMKIGQLARLEIDVPKGSHIAGLEEQTRGDIVYVADIRVDPADGRTRYYVFNKPGWMRELATPNSASEAHWLAGGCAILRDNGPHNNYFEDPEYTWTTWWTENGWSADENRKWEERKEAASTRLRDVRDTQMAIPLRPGARPALPAAGGTASRSQQHPFGAAGTASRFQQQPFGASYTGPSRMSSFDPQHTSSDPKPMDIGGGSKRSSKKSRKRSRKRNRRSSKRSRKSSSKNL